LSCRRLRFLKGNRCDEPERQNRVEGGAVKNCYLAPLIPSPRIARRRTDDVDTSRRNRLAVIKGSDVLIGID
jgi:hypothetical protein